MGHKGIMLHERSQSLKVNYCRILSIYIIKKPRTIVKGNRSGGDREAGLRESVITEGRRRKFPGVREQCL